MITENLYSEILVKPLEHSPTNLYIVSGYSSVAMVTKHLEEKKMLENIKINLIIGMVGKEGLSERAHLAFQELNSRYPNRFTCKYYVGETPVHSKSYAWFKDSEPIIGFIGSANYSINAFLSNQKEAMAEDNPEEILCYYNTLLTETIDCQDANITEIVEIYERSIKKINNITQFQLDKNETVTLSLLASDGKEVQRSSGLNWGQREKRNPNQAYVAIPAKVSKTNFFPARKCPFTLLTDDGESLICVIAQDYDKAFETKDDNSILGAYFRRRIGLPSGSPVWKENLVNYGRTDITVTKIDDETYYMDFSV